MREEGKHSDISRMGVVFADVERVLPFYSSSPTILSINLSPLYLLSVLFFVGSFSFSLS